MYNTIKNNSTSEKKKVLVYDVDEDNLKLAEISLKDHYHVLKASDVSQVMDQVKNEKPHLILLEAIADGFNIYEKIKAHHNNMKVGFLTVAGQKEHVEKGKQLCADLYIIKPYDPFELVELIKKAF